MSWVGTRKVKETQKLYSSLDFWKYGQKYFGLYFHIYIYSIIAWHKCSFQIKLFHIVSFSCTLQSENAHFGTIYSTVNLLHALFHWNTFCVVEHHTLKIAFPWDFPSSWSIKALGMFSNPSMTFSKGWSCPCLHMSDNSSSELSNSSKYLYTLNPAMVKPYK